MKTPNTKNFSLLISLVISVISVAIIFIAIIYQSSWLAIVFVGLTLFFVLYLVVFYLLNKYIIDHIKPIYELIHHLKMSSYDLFNNVESQDMITQVQSDVTQWAQKKRKEVAKLKASAEFRKEFLANVSHELKTPLFSLQGYVDTLVDGGLDDPEINHKYLVKSQKNIERMIAMVNDLETITRLEAGELQLNFIRFNIQKLINEAIELLELHAGNRNIECIFIDKLAPETKVLADKKMIFEVLSNLISNAVKYGRENGWVKITAFDEHDNKIRIEVTDNGIGISKSLLPRVFERFYRVDKSRSRNQGGTGLGLSIVKHAIKAHHENISVSSEPALGTTFSFTLTKATK